MATDSKNTRTKADYNLIVEKYQAFKQSLSDKLARIDDLKNELKRLDEAYENVKAIKDDLSEYRGTNVERCYYAYSINGYEWYGSTYNEMQATVDTQITPEFQAYIDEIDGILDEIGNKRTEYENSIINETGFLSGLRSSINSLYDEIKNYWN